MMDSVRQVIWQFGPAVVTVTRGVGTRITLELGYLSVPQPLAVQALASGD